MSEPYGVTIFCDDIRQEMSGKHIYIGVYHSVLQINEPPPHVLQKLSFVPTIVIPNTYDFEKFRFVLKKKVDIDEDEEEILVDLEPPLRERGSDPKRIRRQVLPFSLSPMEFKENCYLVARAYFDDFEAKLGVLAIRFRPQKTATSSLPRPATPDE
jgi:hypothetical protein